MAIIVFALAAALGAFPSLRPDPAPPIRIGVLHSLSGTMAMNERPRVDAVRPAVEEINAAGELLATEGLVARP
jgi:urea transport system substrate-binding protein